MLAEEPENIEENPANVPSGVQSGSGVGSWSKATARGRWPDWRTPCKASGDSGREKRWMSETAQQVVERTFFAR